MTDFFVRVDGRNTRKLRVDTDLYICAAAAAMVFVPGASGTLPVNIEVWIGEGIVESHHLRFCATYDEHGRLVIAPVGSRFDRINKWEEMKNVHQADYPR